MDHDQRFKLLLTTYFFEFIELFLPEVAKYLDRDSIEFLDKEVFTDLTAGERHEVDILVKAKFPDTNMFFLIHVENQAKAQGGFPRRMFLYFARLDGEYNLPVYPIAVFSYDAPQRPEEDHYRVAFPDKTVLDFHAIQLNQLDWKDFAEKQNPVAAALMAKMRIAPQDRADVKLASVRMILKLPLNEAQRALVGEFFDSYLRLDVMERAAVAQEVTKLVPEEQEQVMEILNGWVEEGMQRGLEKGLQQGLQRGRSLVLRVLRQKVGELPTELKERLGKLSDSRSEALADALLTFSSPADVHAWLDAHG